MSSENETVDASVSRADKIIDRATVAGLFSASEAKVVAGNFVKTIDGAYDGDWHLVKYVYMDGSDRVVDQKMVSCLGLGKSYEYPVSMRKAVLVREHDSALHKFHGNRTLIWLDDPPFSPVGFDWHILGKAERAYVIGSLPYKSTLIDMLNDKFTALVDTKDKAVKGSFGHDGLKVFKLTAEDDCDTSLIGDGTFFELLEPLFSEPH